MPREYYHFARIGQNTIGYPVPFTPVIPYLKQTDVDFSKATHNLTDTNTGKGYDLIIVSVEFNIVCDSLQSIGESIQPVDTREFVANMNAGMGEWDNDTGSINTYWNTWGSRVLTFNDVSLIVDLVDYRQSPSNENENVRNMICKFPIYSVKVEYGKSYFVNYKLVSSTGGFASSGRCQTITTRGYYEPTTSRQSTT